MRTVAGCLLGNSSL